MHHLKNPFGRTRVSPQHQITIPMEAMRQAGLVAGDRLDVIDVVPGRVVLVRMDDPVARFAGRLTGVYAPSSLAPSSLDALGVEDAPRNEWD